MYRIKSIRSEVEVVMLEKMQDLTEGAIGRKGLTLNALKYIAIIAMLIDHIAHSFVPEGSALGMGMYFIGRTTGPIMFYAAVEGYHHTKDIKKYLLRLFFFAAISWLPFNLFIRNVRNFEDIDWIRQSVIYTIFLGVLAVHIRHNVKNTFLRWMLIFVLCLASIPGDWGTWGFCIIIIFDFYYGRFDHQRFGYILFLLFSQGFLWDFKRPLFSLVYDMEWDLDLSFYVRDRLPEYGMILPIILLSFYNGEKGKNDAFSKYFFYIFYPAHLLILWVIGRFLIS